MEARGHTVTGRGSEVAQGAIGIADIEIPTASRGIRRRTVIAEGRTDGDEIEANRNLRHKENRIRRGKRRYRNGRLLSHKGRRHRGIRSGKHEGGRSRGRGGDHGSGPLRKDKSGRGRVRGEGDRGSRRVRAAAGSVGDCEGESHRRRSRRIARAT